MHFWNLESGYAEVGIKEVRIQTYYVNPSLFKNVKPG